MIYRINVTLEGYIEKEADSEKEALERAEDGFSISDFYCTDSEVGAVDSVVVSFPKSLNQYHETADGLTRADG